MAGMILPGNPGTLNETSSMLPLPGNPTGNINPVPVRPFLHRPPFAVYWSHDELLLLRQGLAEYANESNLMKYIKIAAMLPNKTVRDVALRCRWMTENGKRRKPEDCYAVKKVKDGKQKMVDSSSMTSMHSVQPDNVAAYSSRMHEVHHNLQPFHQGSPIDSETQRLLIENVNLLNQIESNLEMSRLEDNVDLFYRTRENIRTISNRFSGLPGIMSRMPPLNVSIDEELFQSIFPLTDQVYAPDKSHLDEEPGVMCLYR